MLSRDYTAQTFFEVAYRDFAYDTNDPVYVERFDLVNQAIEKTYRLVYPLVTNAYRSKVPYIVSLPGRYLTVAGSATFTASSRKINSSSMNIPFGSSDVERPCIFRSGGSVWETYIEAVNSGTEIVVRGNSLSDVNLTLDEVLIPTTTPVDTHLMLSQLRMDRSGEQLSIVIESSATNLVNPVSLEEFKVWRTSGPNNRRRIVYTLNGDEILVKKGDSLVTYGTLTLYYARIPNRVVIGADKIDLPDGFIMQIGISMLRAIIALRKKDAATSKMYIDETGKFTELAYKTNGQSMEQEILVERIKSLLN